MFFKFLFKTCAAVVIATYAFDIIMGVFDLAQYVVRQSSGVIGLNTSVDISSAITDIQATLLSVAAYTVVLCFTLFKTDGISKSMPML